MVSAISNNPVHVTGRRHTLSGGYANSLSAQLCAGRQANVQPSPQPGHATAESGASSPSTETKNAKIGEKVTNVRGFSHKNKANNATSGDSPFSAHEASELNDIVNSLDSASTYLNKKQCEAINFVSEQIPAETFKKLQAVLSDPGSRSSAVDKAKQAFVMLKMLNDSSAKSDTPNTTEIKKDIDFFVDNINKYGLGTKSPFAGSLLQGSRARSSIDDRLNKTAGKLIAAGLNFNADIDGLVESKINAVQDKDIRATLLSKWKGSAFRPSKLVFDKMEETINESRNFHRIDTLLNHQPIQLELFKAFLQSENPGLNNDASKTGSPTPNKGMSNGASERPINYYDFSVNDNSIHITDGSRISLNEAVDPPKGQEEKSPASATERQNVTPVPDKQSDRSTDGQGDSGGQKRPTATTGMSATTTNSNRPSNETQTPPQVEADENPVSDRGVHQPLHARIFTPQQPQFGATLTKSKRNAEIVQSSEPRSKKWDIPSPSNFLVTPRTGALQGAAEAQSYWRRSAQSEPAIDKKQLFGGGVDPLAKVVSSRTTERGVSNKTDATISANSGVKHTARVAQHKARVEPGTTKVEVTEDGLLVDTVPDTSASKEPSLANRHQVASSGEKNPVTAAGNTAFKGPFWAGGQGFAAKQAYIDADSHNKK